MAAIGSSTTMVINNEINLAFCEARILTTDAYTHCHVETDWACHQQIRPRPPFGSW